MRLLHIIVILICPQFACAGDFRWFENHWISDRDGTVVANQAILSGLNESQKLQFSDQFGQIQWIVKDGMVNVITAEGNSFSNPYLFRPIDELNFEVTMIYSNSDWIFTITKTERGFCLQTAPNWSKADSQWYESGYVECFKPYDA